MIIRDADIKADALAIMTGARDCVRRHREHLGSLNVGGLFPDNDDDLVEAVSYMVTLDGMEILAAEHEGRVVGGMGILYIPYYWNHKLLTADQAFWWTVEDAPFRTAKLLLEEAMRRINERGAMPIFRYLQSSPKGIEKMYKKLNMVPVETTYMRLG
jgi:hypothetical protein